MKHILFIIIGLLSVIALKSQERYFDERYISSLSFLNPVIINPGATGSDGDHHLLLNYKNTWASFEGAPKSLILSYDGPVADRLSFGALLITDTNGELKTTKAQGSVSYTIDAPMNKIGFGLSAEFINHGLSNSALNNNLLEPGDPIVMDRLEGAGFFDVSFGIYGLYNGKLSYGLAFPSLVSSRIESSTSTIEREIGYLFSLAYKYDQVSTDVVLEPSIIIKKLMHVPFHADINILGRFIDDTLRGGISYRVGADESIGFLVGTTIGTLNFTYAYNASRHEFQTYNNGSHELSVRFDIGAKNKANTGVGAKDPMNTSDN